MSVVELGKGRKIDDIIEEMLMVAEGVKSAPDSHGFGQKSIMLQCRLQKTCLK